MTKKYELTEESMAWEVCNGKSITLYRIRALKDFGDVKAGYLGGWVEKEKNLNQGGNCWIGNNAKVYGNAWVSDDAEVYGDAKVYDDAWVSGNAIIESFYPG
nr:hypothetical protein [Melissococcus plutonius]